MRIRSLLRLVVAGLSIACLASCAGVTYKTIRTYGTGDPKTVLAQANAADDAADGIRYYEQVPYLIVYSDGKGGLKSQLLYLPDTTRKKVVHPYAWMANNNLVLTFDKGVLTEGMQTIDETIVPKAAVEAAATALIAAADAAKATEEKDLVPPPALYRIWVNTDGSVELIGGYGLNPDGSARQDLHITVSQPPEKDSAKAK
jgi:hypothetical protein